MIPAVIMSQYSPFAALWPHCGLSAFRSSPTTTAPSAPAFMAIVCTGVLQRDNSNQADVITLQHTGALSHAQQRSIIRIYIYMIAPLFSLFCCLLADNSLQTDTTTPSEKKKTAVLNSSMNLRGGHGGKDTQREHNNAPASCPSRRRRKHVTASKGFIPHRPRERCHHTIA